MAGNVSCLHVDLLPVPGRTGELKATAPSIPSESPRPELLLGFCVRRLTERPDRSGEACLTNSSRNGRSAGTLRSGSLAEALIIRILGSRAQIGQSIKEAHD